MVLKNYSDKTARVVFLGACLAAILAISSCAGVPPSPSKMKTTAPKPAPVPAAIEQPVSRDKTPDARAMASRALTDEGVRLLESRNFNGAIRVLEQAVGVNPQDGPAYYYLAEAWIGKKDPARAAQFNGLAASYLRGDKEWSERVRAQENRIDSVGKSP